ncbi:pyridoxal phosphate homeostasis protein [Abditibacteriota bacterium]|nr:pyridoxal phosphate homeostasis protein [Abditibacteriota bacterium]
MDSLALIRSQIAAACQRVGRDPQEVTLLGASKTVEAKRLEPFCVQGLQDFGENYVQEGLGKVRFFQERGLNPTWHLIGALQSNKARDAVAHFDVIHSLDRLSLAKELDKEARKIGKIQRVLIQVNVGHEDSKAGISAEALPELLESCGAFSHIRVEGLMSLPPYSYDPEQTRPYHRQLRELRDQSSSSKHPLATLSMGMSRDFEIAIEEGATHVRIGTALFGTRSYTAQ